MLNIFWSIHYSLPLLSINHVVLDCFPGVVAGTSNVERYGSLVTSSPWTTQHVLPQHSSPFPSQPQQSATMPSTPAATFFHGPPEHLFGQPTDLHLHWTNRQPAPTLAPHPPVHPEPVPILPHQLTPPRT